jgi:HEAT repeat protein
MRFVQAFAAVLLLATVAAADEVRGLIKQLKNGEVDARRSAAKALGDFGTGAKDAVPALTTALQDGDKFVRRFAAHSLGEIGPDAKQAVPALSALVRNGNEKNEVLDAAVEALGKIGWGQGAVFALVGTLKDTGREPELRRKAAESLGKMGPDARTSIAALVEVLKPTKGQPSAGSGDLRVEAAGALAEIATPADKSAVDALTTLSNDRMLRRDRTLMKAVNDALKKIQAKK